MEQNIIFWCFISLLFHREGRVFCNPIFFSKKITWIMIQMTKRIVLNSIVFLAVPWRWFFDHRFIGPARLVGIRKYYNVVWEWAMCKIDSAPIQSRGSAISLENFAFTSSGIYYCDIFNIHHKTTQKSFFRWPLLPWWTMWHRMETTIENLWKRISRLTNISGCQIWK